MVNFTPEAISAREAVVAEAGAAALDGAAALMRRAEAAARAAVAAAAAGAGAPSSWLEPWESLAWHAAALRRSSSDLAASLFAPQDKEECEGCGCALATGCELLAGELGDLLRGEGRGDDARALSAVGAEVEGAATRLRAAARLLPRVARAAPEE